MAAFWMRKKTATALWCGGFGKPKQSRLTNPSNLISRKTTCGVCGVSKILTPHITPQVKLLLILTLDAMRGLRGQFLTLSAMKK